MTIAAGLCQCGCGQVAPLAPATRRKEGLIKGQPMKFLPGHSLKLHGRRRGPLPERFWRSVENAGIAGCWNWIGSLNTWGYGQIRDEDGQYTTAHRVSWRLHRGAVQMGQSVLHKCDNTKCVNPDHLFLGTQKDNITDMHAKGRGWRTRERQKRGAK